MNTSDVAQRGWLRRSLLKLPKLYKALLPNQRSYVNALVLMLPYLLCKLFNWDISQGFLMLALVFWGMAMAADLQSLYKLIAGTLAGRLVLLAIFAIGANMSFAAAGQTVNGLVGIDPGRFVHTIAFASFLESIQLIVLFLFFALFVGTGFLVLYVVFHYTDLDTRRMIFPWYEPKEDSRYEGFTALVQALSFFAICVAAYSWWNTGQPAYTEFLSDKTKWFLYSFETYEKAPCALEKGQRVAFLDGDRVLMATKVGEEITFAVQECKGGT